MVTFYFYELTHFFRLIEEHFTFYLQYKHSGTFAHRKYEEQSYDHKKSENVRPLVTLLKMRPHYSHSSRENATPSSCTSPLASYQAVSPPPLGGLVSNSYTLSVTVPTLWLAFSMFYI